MSKQTRALKRIRKNVRLKELKSQLESGLFAVDIQKIDTEVEDLHRRRTIRALDENGRESQTKLVKALRREIAYRSRLVELAVQIKRKCSRLTKYTAKMREYLTAKYANDLRAGWSVSAERTAAINMLLEDADELIDDLTAATERIEFIIADIDKASWASKTMVDALALSMSRERNI